MPKSSKFSKDEIIAAAMALVREGGMKQLTARNLGRALGVSACPIFTAFQGMAEVQQAIQKRANELYKSYLSEDMASGKYPPYKASGMAYIRFAREEREFFKLLFMRDRHKEKASEDRESIRSILDLIQTNLNLNEDEAYLFHLEMWLYVHGIATMVATDYLNWKEEFISTALTDAYRGLLYRFTKEKKYGSDQN